jgi:hypothetical protein
MPMHDDEAGSRAGEALQRERAIAGSIRDRGDAADGLGLRVVGEEG